MIKYKDSGIHEPKIWIVHCTEYIQNVFSGQSTCAVLCFVLWHVLKMTETAMQTKGRVKGNVLIFSFYFIFSLPKALLESRTLFPITETI